MPIYIEMPKLSDTMTEGTLVKWRIKPGDKVSVGQVIAEIETDKATMEQESFDAGIVHELRVTEGSKVPLGAVMGVILKEGEAAPAAGSGPSAAPAATKAAAAKSASPAAAKSAAPTATANGGRVKASPLAKKVAAEKGVNLSAVVGSGPGGRIVKNDVLTAPAGGSAAPAAAAVPTIRPVMQDGDERIALSSMRNIIAQRLLASKTQIPHFYLNIEVDAGPLMKLRAQINEAAEKSGNGNKYTVNDFILKAVASAVASEPRVNASFDGDSIVQFKSINVSVAIAVEDGLVTPVIKNADKKSLLEISQAVKDLAKRAKEKKLTPAEFAEGTMTVSNLGAYGIDNFDAIINPPQAIILAIGATKKKPVVDEHGNIVSGERMWIGMSCDHRVVDGAVAATYMGALRKLIENPALMFV
jgi:pyruvate dehydrogenase E2 component (dihydrolipoamide acetyltransferase)